jgi:hypothetical protein
LLLLKPQNDFDFTFVLHHLLAFGHFRQLLDINLSTETAAGTGGIGGATQLLESLQVFVGKSVGADGTERSG